MTGKAGEFDVGGVRLARPFKLLRLGHFGVNATDPEAARDFYCRILGFRVSDPIDFGARLPEGERGKHGPGIGYFARHGADHHSFVLFPRRVMAQVNPHYRKHPEVTVNQMTWQVSSLREVVEGIGKAAGCSTELDYVRYYPATVNDAQCAAHVLEAARALFGTALLADSPAATSEDFAFMLQKVPGAYVWLGQGRDASSPQLHDPAYDFNDEVLPHGAALLAALAESRLAARHVLP